MKRLLILLILTALLIAAIAFPAAAVGSGSLSVSSATAKQGDTVTLKVSVSKNPGLVTLSIQIKYDTNVLQLTKVSDAGLLVGSQLNSNYNSPYKITWIDGSATTNNTKTGTIATLTFKVKDAAAVGKTNVSVSCDNSFDTNYGKNTFSGGSGTVTVTCKTHKYDNWTKVSDSQHQRTCSVCKEVVKENHKWDSGKVTKATSCKEAGTKEYTCTVCNAKKTETIAKTKDHKYTTYTNLNGSSHTAVCTVCQQKATLSHSWKVTKVNKEATCQESGSRTVTCKNCNAKKDETIAKLAHNFSAWTSLDEKNHTRTCSSCKLVETKAHNFGDKLLHDDTVHYSGCSDCNFAKDQQDHVPGPAATAETDQICTVCNRVLQLRTNHQHELEVGWISDEQGHWNKCNLCDQKCNFTEHTYEDNCQSNCTICDAQRIAPHDPDGTWANDAQGHWQICKSCNEKVMSAPHTPGAEATAATPQCCTDCGYQLSEILSHNHFDGKHTHICECGETYDADENCSICAEHRSEFPWWIVCVAEAVVFIGIALTYFLLIRKKKEKGMYSL